MKNKQSTFIIKNFSDYHEIRSNIYKTIELGCFPTKDYGYFRYFGLFYKGVKPTFEKIFNRMKTKVHIGEFYHERGNGENIGITLDDLKFELKQSLKISPDMPGSR